MSRVNMKKHERNFFNSGKGSTFNPNPIINGIHIKPIKPQQRVQRSAKWELEAVKGLTQYLTKINPKF